MGRRPKDKRKKVLPGVVLGIVLGAVPAFAVNGGGAQATVGTLTAVEIGTASAARFSLAWLNNDTANPIYCSYSSSVTSSTGMPIPHGIGFTLDSCVNNHCDAQPSVYCIATGGSVNVGYWESE